MTSGGKFYFFYSFFRRDFENWKNLGNVGWGYDDVLPYFIKSENCSLCNEIDEKFHGREGYLNVENPRYESPLVKLFIKAGQQMGYRNNDPNGRYGLGKIKLHLNILIVFLVFRFLQKKSHSIGVIPLYRFKCRA